MIRALHHNFLKTSFASFPIGKLFLKKLEEGRLRFLVPALSLPDEKPQGAGLHYTLVTDAGAVSGLLPYP